MDTRLIFTEDTYPTIVSAMLNFFEDDKKYALNKFNGASVLESFNIQGILIYKNDIIVNCLDNAGLQFNYHYTLEDNPIIAFLHSSIELYKNDGKTLTASIALKKVISTKIDPISCDVCGTSISDKLHFKITYTILDEDKSTTKIACCKFCLDTIIKDLLLLGPNVKFNITFNEDDYDESLSVVDSPYGHSKPSEL